MNTIRSDGTSAGIGAETAAQAEAARALVKDVMERLVPELSDEFARTMGTVQTLGELRQLIRQGFDGYVAKPIEIKKLLDAISLSLKKQHSA